MSPPTRIQPQVSRGARDAGLPESNAFWLRASLMFRASALTLRARLHSEPLMHGTARSTRVQTRRHVEFRIDESFEKLRSWEVQDFPGCLDPGKSEVRSPSEINLISQSDTYSTSGPTLWSKRSARHKCS